MHLNADTLISLVNNAGVGLEALRPPAQVHTTDEDLWDKTMLVNSKSVFLGCKYAIAQMLTQTPHTSGDRGWIVNISSIMALIGGPSNRASFCLPNLCFKYAWGELTGPIQHLIVPQKEL